MAWEVRIWCRIHEEAPNRHVRGGKGGSGSRPTGKWGILHSPEDPERLWRCQTELPRRRTDGQSPGPTPRQSVWGGPLGVGPAPSPPQPRDRVSGFPPEPADPASSAEQLGKAAGPSPGVSRLPRWRGCPSLPSPLPKTQRCGWVWGVFQLPRLPLGQHLRQERRRRRETWPGGHGSRLPEPLSPCQPVMPGRSPRPRTKRAQSTGRSSRWEASSPHPVPPPPPRPVPAAAPRG